MLAQPGSVLLGSSHSAPLLAALRTDCRKVFSGFASFWLGHGDRPRCTLERLAKRVFDHHTGDLAPHLRESSGAEWWVQVRGVGEVADSRGNNGDVGSSRKGDDDDDDTTPDSVRFHWDKDEDLVDDAGIAIFPQLSTVTYLSEGGAPTVVLNRRAPTDYAAVDELYSADAWAGPAAADATDAADAADAAGEEKHAPGDKAGVQPTAWLCYPSAGTHLVFDGRFLHGAPGCLARSPVAAMTVVPRMQQPAAASSAAADQDSLGFSTSVHYTRITFLVNVWVGHRPTALAPLPEELLQQLGDVDIGLVLSPLGPQQRQCVGVGTSNPSHKASKRSTLGAAAALPTKTLPAKAGRRADDAPVGAAVAVAGTADVDVHILSHAAQGQDPGVAGVFAHPQQLRHFKFYFGPSSRDHLLVLPFPSDCCTVADKGLGSQPVLREVVYAGDVLPQVVRAPRATLSGPPIVHAAEHAGSAGAVAGATATAATAATVAHAGLAAIPTTSPVAPWAEEALRLFRRFGLCLVKGAVAPGVASGTFGWTQLEALARELPEQVADTWATENGTHLTPQDLFGTYGTCDEGDGDDGTNEAPTRLKRRRTESSGNEDNGQPRQHRNKASRPLVWNTEQPPQWYCSFVLNKSTCPPGGFERTLKTLAPTTPHLSDDVTYTPNVWFFFGNNHAKTQLAGRTEHTDVITHHGTWHVQLSGCKVWRVRPDEGAAGWPGGAPPQLDDERLVVVAEAGDLLLINTMLWFHETALPPAPGLCFSFARDFYLDGSDSGDDASDVEMGNLEDTWATQAVAHGTVIAHGDEVPPNLREVGPSEQPSCHIEWGPRTRTSQPSPRLIASRDIASGESLTIARGTRLP
eukprot:m.300401 g.300401  ORF g.300401 m.300401 type:complete len:860 (-) comp19555_c3_seq4:232-2811(-)